MGGFLDMLIGGNDDAMNQAKQMFGGELPNIGAITNILGSAPEAAIQQASRTAMHELEPSQLGQFGGVLDTFLGSAPQVAQNIPNLNQNIGQIGAGNADVIGDVVGGLLKSQGLGALSSIFAGGQPAPEPPSMLDNVLGMFGLTGDDGKFGITDLLGLIQNPIAGPMIMKLLPSLMKVAV
jgi:hypothetical protein